MNTFTKRLLCLQCNKELNRGQKKFCCSSCAATYNNAHRISTTKGKKKQVKCISCGKEICVSIHSSKDSWICNDCKAKSYKVKHPSICKICGTTNCTNEFCKHPAGKLKQIESLIKFFGFDRNKLGTKEVFDEYNRVRNELYDLYINQQKSSVDIANIYGYKYNVFQILYNLGIPTRKSHDANVLCYLQGKLNGYTDDMHYKAEWHTTWDDKEVYLRSSYELDYAKELDEKQISYEVESLRIKYFDTQQKEYRCAIPDFYIPSTNTIVEIKSNWTYDEQNMKDKFKTYKDLGYNTKLILEHKETDINS